MKNLIIILAIIFSSEILVSCGTEEGSSSATEETGKEILTDEIKDPDSVSYMVDSLDELPACDDATERELGYVMDLDSFYSCQKGAWEKVSIKGERGEKGEKGDSGSFNPNLWEDPFTERKWIIGGSSASSGVSCPSGYVVPTINDAQEAYNHGITMVDNVPMKMWVRNISNGLVEAYKDLSDFSTVVTTIGGSIFCAEE